MGSVCGVTGWRLMGRIANASAFGAGVRFVLENCDSHRCEVVSKS